MNLFRNGDSGAQHSQQAVQARQAEARAHDRRTGAMTHNQGRTLAEVKSRPGK